jgi:DtxR family Mn-dependent transcriptional regulator
MAKSNSNKAASKEPWLWKRFESDGVTHTVSHYLCAIADLLDSHGYARVTDVSKKLKVSRGGASLTLKSLKQKGLVLEDENRFVRLSDEGRHIVDRVKAQRFVVERFLREFLGVSDWQANADACKFEHLISGETAEKIARFLRFWHHNPDAVDRFMDAWKADREECESDPESCPACRDECLREVVDADIESEQ